MSAASSCVRHCFSQPCAIELRGEPASPQSDYTLKCIAAFAASRFYVMRPRAATGIVSRTRSPSTSRTTSTRFDTTQEWFGTTRTRSPGSSAACRRRREPSRALPTAARSSASRPSGRRRIADACQHGAVAGGAADPARQVVGQRLAAAIEDDPVGAPASATTVASTVSAQSSSVAAPSATCVRS